MLNWTEQYLPDIAATTPPVSNCTYNYMPVYDRHFVAALKAAVSITCLFSIFGAGLIVFTYAAFKNLRTIAREILVQLSIADIIVALSHMVGVLAVFPRYIPKHCESPDAVMDLSDKDIACEVQGGVAMFGTISSFLWTIAVAVYLLSIIVLEKPRFARCLRLIFYPICWGIPLSLVVWFGLDDYLGFEESVDIGWCYVKWVNISSAIGDRKRNIVPQVLGYELWLYLTFLVLPFLYIWIRCYIRAKISQVHDKSLKLHAKAKMADFKLTFVPLIFLFLRMWSFILSIPHCYLPFHTKDAFRKTSSNAVLVLLAGIGCSAQGLMNSILFCACTPVVRRHLSIFLRRLLCFPCKKKIPKFSAITDSEQEANREMDDTTDYDEPMERQQQQPGCVRTLLVNGDRSEFRGKGHLLNVGAAVVTFDYQSVAAVRKE